MAFYIYVRGNQLHDEGEHDGEGKVARSGGGPLEFRTKKEAEAVAETVYERAVAHCRLHRWRPPERELFVVLEAPRSSS